MTTLNWVLTAIPTIGNENAPVAFVSSGYPGLEALDVGERVGLQGDRAGRVAGADKVPPSTKVSPKGTGVGFATIERARHLGVLKV